MVVLLTPDAISSPWVRREMEYALGAKRYSNRLIPVAIGDRDRIPAHDVPWIVRQLPWVELEDLEQGPRGSRANRGCNPQPPLSPRHALPALHAERSLPLPLEPGSAVRGKTGRRSAPARSSALVQSDQHTGGTDVARRNRVGASSLRLVRPRTFPRRRRLPVGKERATVFAPGEPLRGPDCSTVA